MWIRIVCNGDENGLVVQARASDLDPWSDVFRLMFFTSEGHTGFAGGPVLIDDLTVKYYINSNWTEAYVEDFDVTSGYCELEPLHDANGNLTYDGSYVYTYDGWNRLETVALALPDDTISPSDADSDPDAGPTIATIEYDGLGRRILKNIENSGDWNNEYNYYYDGWKVAEIRNAGDEVCSQYVWGLNYIDELCMVRWQFDAGAVRQVRDYYALQDANYNVMGVVDSEGNLTERYEYTPYGQRTAYSHQHLMLSDYNEDGTVNLDDFTIVQANIGSAGTHAEGDGDGDGYIGLDDFILLKQELGRVVQTGDPLLYQASNESLLERGDISLCPVGHQGLFWDKEYGIYNNRTRPYDPILGRFPQRDMLNQNEVAGGYHDGMNRFEYEGSGPNIRLDSKGYTYRSDIDGDRLIYSCNCGWIDWGHAVKGIVSFWDQMVSESGKKSRYRDGFKVTATMFHHKEILGIVDYKETIKLYPSYVPYGLETSEKESVALGIFKDMAWFFEKHQASAPYRWIADSGFSEEDLPSDLLGFYMKVRNVDAGTVALECETLTKPQSKCVWDETGGVKNYKPAWTGNHWEPRYHHKDSKTACSKCKFSKKSWPSMFDSIVAKDREIWKIGYADSLSWTKQYDEIKAY